MSSTLTTATTGTSARSPVPRDDVASITLRLKALALESSSLLTFYRRCIGIIAEHFHAPFGLIQVDLPSGSTRETSDACNDESGEWARVCERLVVDVRFRRRAIAKMFVSSELERTFAVLAVPMADESIVGAAIVVATECDSQAISESRLRELQMIVAQLPLLANGYVTNGETIRESPADDLTKRPEIRGLAAVAKFETSEQLAFAIVNDVKTKSGCDEACLGIVEESRVALKAISGLAEFNRKSPGVSLVTDVMNECMDANRILHYPNPDGDQFFLLRRWHQHVDDSGPVAAIPLSNDQGPVAILALRYSTGDSVSETKLLGIQQRIAPLAPGIELLSRANLSGASRLWRSAKAKLRSVSKPVQSVLYCLVFALLTWCLFGQVPYRVNVPCRLASQHVCQISAPWEAKILKSQLETGQCVDAGDILVELDAGPLQLTMDRLTADYQRLELRLNRAIGERKESAAELLAELASVDAERQLVRLKMQQSLIRAPFDAIVLEGNLRHREGDTVPVGEALLKLGSRSQLELALEVPQSDATFVAIGQQGRFVPVAKPESAFEFSVQQVGQSSEIVNGRTIYAARANVHSEMDWLRPGMTGFASIETGRQPVWWIVTHKLANLLRLQLWKL